MIKDIMTNKCCQNEIFSYEGIFQKILTKGHMELQMPFWSLCKTGDKKYNLCTREQAYYIEIGDGSLNYVSYSDDRSYMYLYTFMRSQAFEGTYNLPIGDHYTIGKRDNKTDLHRTFYHMKSLKPCYTFYEINNNTTVNDILNVCAMGRCKNEYSQQACAYFENFVCKLYGSSVCNQEYYGGNINSSTSIIESTKKKTLFQRIIEKHIIPTFENSTFNLLFVSKEERVGFLTIIDNGINERTNTSSINENVIEHHEGKITYVYPIELTKDTLRFVTLDYVEAYLRNSSLPNITSLNECQINALFSSKEVALAFATILMSSTEYEKALACIQSSNTRTCSFNEVSKTLVDKQFCTIPTGITAYGGNKKVKITQKNKGKKKSLVK
jgi:hypothetical protein